MGSELLDLSKANIPLSPVKGIGNESDPVDLPHPI